MGSSHSNNPSAEGADESKPSLYQRMQEKKRGPPISDEDLAKYTGKTRAEFDTWAESQPGVGKNQVAGRIAQGSASGLAGMAAAEGLGGWGPNAEPSDPSRGMKFPPAAQTKIMDESAD